MSKWGVPDDVTFEKFYSLIKEQSREPFMKMFLTLSSHEPFDVPMNRLEDKYLNSIAYTDSCVGDFVEKLKRLLFGTIRLSSLSPTMPSVIPKMWRTTILSVIIYLWFGPEEP